MKTTYQERQKFYASPEWRTLRAYKVELNPVCERCIKKGCAKPTEEVHHKIDIADNWELRLDLDNLESLCTPCHSLETNARKYQKQRQGKIINKRYDIV